MRLQVKSDKLWICKLLFSGLLSSFLFQNQLRVTCIYLMYVNVYTPVTISKLAKVTSSLFITTRSLLALAYKIICFNITTRPYMLYKNAIFKTQYLQSYSTHLTCLYHTNLNIRLFGHHERDFLNTTTHLIL